MSEELELETFLSISPNILEIYLFDKKKSTNIYRNELKINNGSQTIDFTKLNEFLEDNIFQIEKLIGKFIKNIILIIESKKILTFEIGVKKKNFNKILNRKDVQPVVIEVKDYVKENHQGFRIIHIIIDKFIINDNLYSGAISDLNSDHLSLELKFILIPDQLTLEIENMLEKYQIKTDKYLNSNYIKKYFLNKEMSLSGMANQILSGCNENEVQVVPKSLKRKGFFEKFFQLFS